ncbi:MAG: hypothetical protein WCO06_05330 [Candidatus Roizmanbacteria bacterium]
MKIKEELLQSIKEWMKKIEKTRDYRNNQKYDNIIDEQISGNFYSLQELINNYTDDYHSKIADLYVRHFDNFSARVGFRLNDLLGSDSVVDSLSSISYILYLIDEGYEMYGLISNIYEHPFIDTTIRHYYLAIDQLLHRRNVLSRYLTRFDNKVDEQELENSKKKWGDLEDLVKQGQLHANTPSFDSKEAYDALMLIGMNGKISFQEYESEIEKLSPLGIDRLDIFDLRNLNYEILKKNNFLITFNQEDEPSIVLEEIKKRIPGFEYKIEKVIPIRDENGTLSFFDSSFEICGVSFQTRIPVLPTLFATFTINKILSDKFKLYMIQGQASKNDEDVLIIMPLENIDKVKGNQYLSVLRHDMVV